MTGRCQRDAGERRALQAIAPRAATGGDQDVPGLHFLLDVLDRDRAHRSAEDEWVVDVSLVESDGTAGGRNAHAVAVIANTTHYAAHDAQRMNHVLRLDVRFMRIRRPEAEHVQ